MARPKKQRLVFRPPEFKCFKPVGIRAAGLRQLKLNLDEYEAIRLADGEGLDQAEAARLMGISRPTFSRLIEKARSKTADFLINGAMLVVEGGKVALRERAGLCGKCGARLTTDLNKTFACPECGGSGCAEDRET